MLTVEFVTKLIEDAVLVVWEKFPNLDFPIPNIDTTLKGNFAGKAIYSKYMVKINLEIPEHGARNTVFHEVAHLVAHKLYPIIERGHGRYWRSIMYQMGEEPTRCHNYGLTPARKKRKFSYKCEGCSKHYTVSSIIHNRITKKNYRYFCSNCKCKILRFVGEII